MVTDDDGRSIDIFLPENTFTSRGKRETFKNKNIAICDDDEEKEKKKKNSTETLT